MAAGRVAKSGLQIGGGPGQESLFPVKGAAEMEIYFGQVPYKGERIRIIFPPSGLQVFHFLLLNPAEMSTIVMVTRPDIGLRFHQGTSMHRWLIKEKTRTPY